MQPWLNNASFASMTNFGLRFTLAGWNPAAKSAKLNRQRKLVDLQYTQMYTQSTLRCITLHKCTYNTVPSKKKETAVFSKNKIGLG